MLHHVFKSIRSITATYGRLTLTIGTGALLALAALSYKLSSLIPTLSSSERSALSESSRLHVLFSTPTNLPLKLPLWLSQHLLHGAFAARMPSVAAALLALCLFTYILHRWYGPRSTVFGFFLILSSAWFLHTARFAGPDIEYVLAILALISVHIGLYDHGDNGLMLYGWIAVNIVLLFIPGLLWFVLLGLVWQIPTLWTGIRRLPLWVSLLWTLCAAVGVGTAVAVLLYHPQFWAIWFGIPSQLLPWRTILGNLGTTLVALVYRGPHNPEIWLGQVPLLDAFLSIMLLAGMVFYAQHWRAQRTHMLGAYLLAGMLLRSLGGPVSLAILMPIVYLIAVAGIAYVLHFWLRVFPRNPLARSIGIGVVTLVVALSCIYNLQQYFVAWPHNPETLATYRTQSP